MNRLLATLLIVFTLSVSSNGQETPKRIRVGRVPREMAKVRGYIYSGGVASEPINILRMPEAHRELQLTESQLHLVSKLCQEFKLRVQQSVAAIPRQVDDRQAAVDLARQNIWQDLGSELEGIMSPEQRKRLAQLRVQMVLNGNGVVGVSKDPQLANALQISNEQARKIEMQYYEEERRFHEEFKQKRDAFKKRMLLKLLTPEQLVRLRDISGDDFAYKTDAK